MLKSLFSVTLLLKPLFDFIHQGVFARFNFFSQACSYSFQAASRV